tara:strand:+ start:125 stop:805 length:681 start_codon:yes stop_codon:yes gene_type:complete
MNKSEKVQIYLKQQSGLFGRELFLKDSESSKSSFNSNSENKVSANKISQLYKSISIDKKESLGGSSNQFVFGIGDPNADLMLVGEAPGEKEDIIGEPFVGRSGKLLNKILSAIDINRNDGVFITNVLKTRPPNNRDPLASEIKEWEPYLISEIKIIKPRLIVALGKVSGNTLLKKDSSLKEMRETLHDYFGTPLKVTYHPAALLRNPNLKRDAWLDFQWVRDFLKG